MRAHVVRTGSRRGSLTSELAGQEPCSAAPPNFSRRSSRQWGEGGGSATVARCPARPVPEHRVCGKTASLGPAVMPSLGGRDTGSPLRSCLSPSTVFCPSHPPPRPRSRHRQEAREHPPNHQKSQDAALSWRGKRFPGSPHPDEGTGLPPRLPALDTALHHAQRPPLPGGGHPERSRRREHLGEPFCLRLACLPPTRPRGPGPQPSQTNQWPWEAVSCSSPGAVSRGDAATPRPPGAEGSGPLCLLPTEEGPI